VSVHSAQNGRIFQRRRLQHSTKEASIRRKLIGESGKRRTRWKGAKEEESPKENVSIRRRISRKKKGV